MKYECPWCKKVKEAGKNTLIVPITAGLGAVNGYFCDSKCYDAYEADQKERSERGTRGMKKVFLWTAIIVGALILFIAVRALI